MSDNLISRKAALQILYDIKDDDNTPKNYGTLLDIIRKIRELPTVFDKEKVIEELVELRQREYNDSDEESETMDGEEIYDEGRSQGRFEAYHGAIEIVGKGGIE